MAAILMAKSTAAVLVARNALTDAFSLPLVLGIIAVTVFLIGLACLIKIGMSKDARSIAY